MPDSRGHHGVTVPAALLEFARAHRTSRVLSVYIAGGESDPAGQRRWEVNLKRGIAEARRAVVGRPRTERNLFEACVSLLVGLLPDGHAIHRTGGWVCFVSATGDSLAESLSTPVESSVDWRDGPRLVPSLASAARRAAIVVAADREHAVLYRLADSVLTELESHESHARIEAGMHMGNTPRLGFHPGTRGETQHDAAERRLRELHDRHIVQTAERVVAVAGTDADIVIGGAHETTGRLASALPPAFSGRTVLADTLHATTPHSDVLRLSEVALRALDSERERALARRLVDEAGFAGHAVAGVSDVSLAIARGAVGHLLLSQGLVSRLPAEVERLVQDALFTGAAVEIASGPTGSLLDSEAGGLVARLRFPSGSSGVPRAARSQGRKSGGPAQQA